MSDTESSSAVYIVDDNPASLADLSRMLRAAGYVVRTYPSGSALLADLGTGSNGCILSEMRISDMTGFDLLEALHHIGCDLPTIFLTEHGTIPSAVRAIRHGAEDFLSKSPDIDELLSVVHRAMERDLRQRAERVRLGEVKVRMRSLTTREREVLEHVLQGQRNKQIARELDIHERTVKLHRTNIATKLRVRSIAVMSRLAEESGAFSHGRAEPGLGAELGHRMSSQRSSSPSRSAVSPGLPHPGPGSPPAPMHMAASEPPRPSASAKRRPGSASPTDSPDRSSSSRST